MDEYVDFDAVARIAEGMGYRLWKARGLEVTRDGVLVKWWKFQYDANAIKPWLEAKRNDPAKLNPLTPAERETVARRWAEWEAKRQENKGA